MRKRLVKQASCFVLVLALLISAMPAAFAAQDARAVSGAANKYVVSETNYSLAAGVTETDVLLNDQSGNNQVAGYMLTVSPQAKASFKASYHGYYTAGSTPATRAEKAKNLTWGMARPTDQAAAYENATGEKVLFATNGDYYNMQTAQPYGYLVMEGNTVQTDDGMWYEPYFAVLKDGSCVIRDYGVPHDDVAEAISGPFLLVRNGVNVADPNNYDLMPRNSIGIKADGTIVTFVADGRQAPYSVGMTYYELAEFLRVNGCVDALYLDGGGSASFSSVREGTEEMVVRNSPSDGLERTVTSALLLVSEEVSDGSFDHASLYPNNEVYTPGSTVEFEALGVDKAGQPADVPADLSWYVPANQGTITADGVFTAKDGYIGKVEVSLRKGQTVYGQTSIEIAEIDELYFASESISLDFDTSSDLGLVAKYQRRNIHFKAGDFTWQIKSNTEGVADAQVGEMKGNLFHSAAADSSINGQVTVTYNRAGGTPLTDTIQVEIGKMPVVLQDFEPKADGKPLQAGHYHWGSNKFHAADNPERNGYTGSFPTLDVITAGTYSDNPVHTTLTAPYIFSGNYDSAVPAAPILGANGYSYYLWPNGTITEYMAGDLKMTSRAEGGQVRSGNYAMELDYDYASYDGSKNANFYIRNCGGDVDIEGYPTEIGIWVYAPEGTSNYALAMDMAVWDPAKGDYATKNRWLTTAAGTAMGTEHGIDWSGWMYCYTNVEDLWPLITPEHPLKIRQGEGFLWLSYQPGKNLGGRYNGALYFDDYRVVYGTSLDDLVNPAIDSVKVNGTEIAADGSTVIDSSAVEIETAFHDPESKNRTGIDAAKTVMFIDDKNIALDGSDAEAVTRTSLGNGYHTITVQVADGDGNMATVTRSFKVEAKDAVNAQITVETPSAVTLGSKYAMEIKANSSVSAFDLSMVNINSDFCQVQPVVTFADGVTGTAEYTPTGFRKASLDLHAEKADGMSGTLATITFSIPATVDPEVDFFLYQVKNITFQDMEGKEGTDAYGPVKETVSAYYTVEIGTQLAGRDCTITVKDVAGKEAAGVNVLLNGTQIGTTGEDGTLTTNAMASLPELSNFIITAQSDLGLSFEAKGTVFGYAGNNDALPTSIQHRAAGDPATTQTISWFSNPSQANEKAYVRYMSEDSYNKLTRGAGPDSRYFTVRGTSSLVAFPISKNAALLNTVTIDELTPDTTYYYWVGDGGDENWSAARSFRTAKQDAAETAFYVLGDTQMLGDPGEDTEAIEMLNTVLAAVGEKGAAFGLQAGDFIDNGGTYGHYQEILDVFQNSAVGTKPVIHVAGNHEYFGDLTGTVAGSVLGLPGRDYYSLERDGVYIAVINNSADLEEAAAWLKEDAAKSQCQWKMLSIHQPPYYTNKNGGNEKFNAILPAAAEAAGIDVVFSGHDHAYARTEPLKAGRVAEDGTVYMICGDLGEKSRDLNYAATDNPDFHFAMVTQEYSAVYVMVKTTEENLTVTAYDLDGTILDTFSKTVQQQKPDDPDDPGEKHNYVYIRDKDQLICSDEGCQLEAPKPYTGWAKDSETGARMYFVGSKFVTDWFTIGEDSYHFDPVTGNEHQLARVNKVDTTCTDRGHTDLVCSCGETMSFDDVKPTGHHNEEKAGENGTVYYVCKNCGRISKFNLTFIDVADIDWFTPYVEYACTNGLLYGRSNAIFDPNTPMTRAELVNVIWRHAGSPEFDNVDQTAYEDCETRSWYVAGVNWAAKNGIVKGVNSKEFAPNDPISREQIVTIFHRYAEFLKMDTTATDSFNTFVDAALVSDYAREPMAWAVGCGIIEGDTAQRLSPQARATRAQVATMIVRLHKLTNEA